MTTSTGTRTEHSGAKNGGGFRGRREAAKRVCKRLRRARDKQAVKGARCER